MLKVCSRCLHFDKANIDFERSSTICKCLCPSLTKSKFNYVWGKDTKNFQFCDTKNKKGKCKHYVYSKDMEKLSLGVIVGGTDVSR